MLYGRRNTDIKGEYHKNIGCYNGSDRERKLKNALFIGALVIGSAFGLKQIYDINTANTSKPAKTHTAAVSDLESRTADINLK
jgi:hypothetical protein